MLKSFIISFKLKNTYKTNTIIYSLKQIPIIKKLLPLTLYKNKKLKIFANIISIISEIFSIFIWKFIYIFLMIFLVSTLYKTNSAFTFLHIYVCLTLIGGIFNTYMFNPTKDKYYAIIIMNMNAKEYTLSNYYYSMLKVLIGFLPFTIIFGLISQVSLLICLILPIFVVTVKISVVGYFLNSKNQLNENLPPKIIWILTIILLIVAYALPLINITITIPIFIAILVISIVLGIINFYKIKNYNNYQKICKGLLKEDNVPLLNKETNIEITKEAISKSIEYDKTNISNKNGYAFFHETFVKRHSKILTKSSKKLTIIVLIIFILFLIGSLLNKEFSKGINEVLMTYLPYFVFVMYILNRGTIITQAMYMNCDHSMLTYRMYRIPKVILGLFKERLKTIIKINLLPSFIIAIGLPILLFISGGTSNILNYLILFASIIAMSIFFSVHYLILYYLLQPYNINTEMKSSTYGIITSLTYLVCYLMIQIKLPTFQFGIAMIFFCVLYVIISLWLVYKYAPKTFKIRT